MRRDTRYRIDLFPPPEFRPAPLNLGPLEKKTGKKYHYASQGRFALEQILLSLNIRGAVALPVYVCDTVLVPVRRLGLKAVFYDLDPLDLNADIDSFRRVIATCKPQAVLTASLYGNPASLLEMENICRSFGVPMIDDAAQSFGAELQGRLVGTFGEAGFFSFSPGKPLAGPMGAFFWTSKNPANGAATRHPVYHRIVSWDFRLNRLRLEANRYNPLRFAVRTLKRLGGRILDISRDKPCPFEEPVMGGLLEAVLNGFFPFRKKWQDRFTAEFSGRTEIRPVLPLRGIPYPHKLVAVADRSDTADRIAGRLRSSGIACGRGYRLLTGDLGGFPGAAAVNGRVLELPIVDNPEKMEYLFRCFADTLTGGGQK